MWRTFLNWAGKYLMRIADNNQNIGDKSYLESRITQWLTSKERMQQILGERYYRGQHDILKKKRTVLGEGGVLTEIDNLPNNIVVDNQYAKFVDQKKNYVLGQPISIGCKDEGYADKLKKVFNKKFHRTLKEIGENAMNGGITWLCPYVRDGKIMFRCFPAYEILPFWNDVAHTELEKAVRLYLEEKPNAKTPYDVIQRVEIYTKTGIEYYTFENNRLHPDTTKPHAPYMTVTSAEGSEEMDWNGRIPLVAFKLNAKEIPLITRVKSLQDAINKLLSGHLDRTDEDARNTILVLENYDGQDLGEFRKNLAQYGAVKVRAVEGARGDVRTLMIEIDPKNFETILYTMRKALKDNIKGYDFSELNNAASDPNQMNIKSILSDVDIDANDMETEFQAAFEELLWFINIHLNVPEDEAEEVEIIFNRDGIINEIEVMQMLVAAGLKLPNELLLRQVPFVDDVEEAKELLKKEEQEAMDAYGGMVPPAGGQGTASQRLTRPVTNTGGKSYGNDEQRK